MKICIWTTSLQADTLAMAIALDREPEVELLVVAASLAAYQHEPIARFCPLTCQLLDRSRDDHEKTVRAFDADVFFADNHIPKYLVGRKMVYFWHGLPLKIRPPRDIRSFRRLSTRLVGNISQPNPRFLAQCYNQMDLDYRIRRLKIAEQNCRIWGSPYSDLLLNPPYRRADLEGYYQLDLQGRKNILLSLTWNFGSKPFGVLGDDDAIFAGLLKTAAEYDANIIFSLHDKFRYQPELIEKIEYYASRYPRSFIKYKNEHADNLADLVVSDVMICNFSSFIVFHYFMGKPSIHIKPVDTKKWFVGLPTMRKDSVQSVLRRNNEKLWLYPFEDNGGCLPRNKDELIADLSRSLEDSSYCVDRAQRFIGDKIYQPDGQTCQRIITDVKEWACDQ
ncbi:MAG: hypothetical protein OER98_16370 [Gammaproteobacteria bacterium]|nr:hypothetical protein [Gammaproteobacteria bacterium]